MGLLVAGITGGASLIDNARITSLKREIDDHIRDVFTFYAKVERLPGDLNNDGQIGHASTKGKYAINSFPSPYQMGDIERVCAPFIELYLYEISSFKPSAVTEVFSSSNPTPFISNGAVPVSKKYKNFIFVHRTDNEDNGTYSSNHIFYKLHPNIKSIDVFMVGQTKQSLDVAKKVDTKFDDGSHSGGDIRGYCNNSHTVDYNDSGAGFCTEMFLTLGNIF
jgi:hypothetical protein